MLLLWMSAGIVIVTVPVRAYAAITFGLAGDGALTFGLATGGGITISGNGNADGTVN